MANFHSRSNSFPSQSHPIVNDVEDHLRRLKASDATSTSAAAICTNLSSLKNLHDDINNMIQMPLIQQSLSNAQSQSWMNELLEGSLKLVDLCEFSREVVCLTKETLQDLESSIRRNRGETATPEDIKARVTSRKKITKMVKKCIKNFNKKSTSLPDTELSMILKETEALVFSVLKSALTLVSGEEEKSKQRNWSILSKLTQTSRVHSGIDNLCSFDIQEVEEGLESLFRSLIKTRVSLLNVLSH